MPSDSIEGAGSLAVAQIDGICGCVAAKTSDQ
jgi:hypothetical protein